MPGNGRRAAQLVDGFKGPVVLVFSVHFACVVVTSLYAD